MAAPHSHTAMETRDYDTAVMSSRSRAKNRSTSQDKRKANLPFIADTFTKDVKKGNVAFGKKEHDRIARYGKGFSNLLQMAATTDTRSISKTGHRPTESLLPSGHEDSIMSPDQYDHEMMNHTPDEL